VVHLGINRRALCDVELGGQLIRAGETVLAAVSAANWDPDRFPAPDRLDLHRDGASHVAFGHGVHQCLGQQLARMELAVAFTELTRRFPSPRLAVPVDQVPMRDSMLTYDPDRLPVTWT